MRVDFPAPFSPTNPWTSPAFTLKLTPFRAWTPGKLLWMSVMETIALDSSAMLWIPDGKKSAVRPAFPRGCGCSDGSRTCLALLWLPLQARRIQEIQDLLVGHVRL